MLPPQLGTTYTDVQVTKRLDTASSQLQQANVQSTHFTCVAMHLLRSAQFLYADYVFHDAVFSAYQQISSAPGGPQELVTISYASVEWQYQPSDDKGVPVGSLVQGNGAPTGASPRGGGGGGGGHTGLVIAVVIVLLLAAGGGGAWWLIGTRRSRGGYGPAEYYADPPGAQFRIGGRVAPRPQTGGPPVEPSNPETPPADTTTGEE